MTAKRIGFTIRPHRYHGDDGFLVYQTSGGGFGTSYDERHRTP